MNDERQPSHEWRSRMYKTNGLDQNEMRRKRREDEVQIRKNHREERFQRNRKIPVERSVSNEEISEVLKTVVDGLQSMQEGVVYKALKQFKDDVDMSIWTIETVAKAQILNKISDIYCNRPFSSTIRQLVCETFIKIYGLDLQKYYELSTDEICIQALVTNISANCKCEEVLCDTFQSIGCFIIRSVTYRNMALDHAIVPELLNVSSATMSIHLQRTLMWLVSLFCDKLDRYSPDVDEIAPLLEIIASGITSSDAMVQTDAASACASLADWPPIHENMQQQKLCSMLVANLSNDKGNARPKVKCGISYIIQATNVFTEEMIDAGLLDVLRGFVNVSYMSQEVCFIISNICVEGEHTIDKLISSGVLREVARVMEAGEYRSRKEAAFVICHCCSSSNRRHLEYVIELGMLTAFTDLLTCMDVSLVAYILDAIFSLLQFGDLNLLPDNSNPVAVKLEEAGCREKLEFLSGSQCVDIHIKSYTILDQFFDDDRIVTTEEIAAAYPPHTAIDNTIEMIIRSASSAPFSF